MIVSVIFGFPVPTSGATTERQDVLVVIGAAGSPEYAALFQKWADRWEAAARAADAGFLLIGLNAADSDKQELTRAIEQLTAAASREPLWIILIGHGTYDGRTARFNLRGPDITAAETAALLNPQRPLALINCSSSSAPFINAVSGPDRIVITATKDGGQIQFARFGDAMSEAISGTTADLNQDGQVSLLEAWALASRRTEEFYSANGRLATEHSLLDDNGDGLGSRSNAYDGVQLLSVADGSSADGDLARRWHLVRSEEERQLSVEHRVRRDELERRLEEIRRRRDDFTDAEYLNQLEAVLVPLAQLYREIAAGQSTPPKSSAVSTDSEKPHN